MTQFQFTSNLHFAFQATEFHHKRKNTTRSDEACALKALPREIAFVINLFKWKLHHICSVLSCSSSFPTENISRFIFHFSAFFLPSLFVFPSSHRKILSAHGSRFFFAERGNIRVRSLSLLTTIERWHARFKTVGESLTDA